MSTACEHKPVQYIPLTHMTKDNNWQISICQLCPLVTDGKHALSRCVLQTVDVLCRIHVANEIPEPFPTPMCLHSVTDWMTFFESCIPKNEPHISNNCLGRHFYSKLDLMLVQTKKKKTSIKKYFLGVSINVCDVLESKSVKNSKNQEKSVCL